MTPPPITGISEEEAEELRLTISELKEELTTTRVNLGRVETNNAKLSESALSSSTNVPRTVACSEVYVYSYYIPSDVCALRLTQASK